MSEELKPCPFCGGTKMLPGSIRDGAQICCANFKCLATVTAFNPNAQAKASTIWNTRTPSEVTP